MLDISQQRGHEAAVDERGRLTESATGERPHVDVDSSSSTRSSPGSTGGSEEMLFLHRLAHIAKPDRKAIAARQRRLRRVQHRQQTSD